MKRKFATIATAALCAFGAFVFAACDLMGTVDTTSDIPSDGVSGWGSTFTVQTAYAQAQELGYQGSLEEFITSISGKNGENGKDGIGIQSIVVNEDGELIVTLSGNVVTNLGKIIGENGSNGADGKTPYIGENGNWWIGEQDSGIKAAGEDLVACEHDYAEWKVGVQPSCGGMGYQQASCLSCGNIVYEFLAPNEHNFTEWKTLVRTADTYVKYATCIECGLSKIEDFFNCVHEYTLVKEVLASCEQDGLRQSKCDICDDVYEEILVALGHDKEAHEAKAATCTEVGYEAYETCKREGCEYTTYAELPALEHDIESYVRKEPTCTEIGYEAYERCKREGCEYTTYVELPALEHDIESYERKKPTCTEFGYEAYERCKREDCEYTTYVEIPALEHDIESYEYKEPTCTQTGYEAYEACKREDCNYTTYAEIPALGHSYLNRACERCGEREPSVGLAYTLINDGTQYEVSGMGTCTDREIVIPATHNDLPVVRVGCYAFNDTDLTGVIILDGVQSIESQAFRVCESLTNVTIPDSVQSIGEEAFSFDYDLTSVIIGKGVQSIGRNAFYSCYKLVEVINKSDLPITKGKSDYGDVGLNAKQVLVEEPEVSNFTVQDEYRFYNFNGTEYLIAYTGRDAQIVLPNPLQGQTYNLYHYVFYGKDNLTSVTIPYGVQTIGQDAFYDCFNLTNVDIPKSVTTIYGAFQHCSALESITIPESVTQLESGMFYNCRKLASVTLHSNITRIWNEAFRGCAQLTNITIPENLTRIDDGAFADCTSLTSVTMFNKVEWIGSRAFSNCTSLESIHIPDSVVHIGMHAFGGCANLTGVTFEATNNWCCCPSSVHSSTSGSIVDISNGETNVVYLKETYLNCRWDKVK